MNQITLIASYPKSGNTWLRVILCNLLSKGDDPVSINNIFIPWGLSRNTLENLLGIDTSDLTSGELTRLIPYAIHKFASDESIFQPFIKTHSRYPLWDVDHSRFPHHILNGVVYLIRNPLDICVSLSFHSAISIDRAIANMEDRNFTFFAGKNRPRTNLSESVSCWSNNVDSWVSQDVLPVLFVRYEDMRSNPFKSVSRILDFCSIEVTYAQIKQAILFSEIDRLREEENTSGFVEKDSKSDSFFRKGLVGDCANHLTHTQIARIVSKHGTIMSRFGYSE